MKCEHCYREVQPGEAHTYTAPDGDLYHDKCIPLMERERDHFFNTIIHDDQLFNDWMGF